MVWGGGECKALKGKCGGAEGPSGGGMKGVQGDYEREGFRGYEGVPYRGIEGLGIDFVYLVVTLKLIYICMWAGVMAEVRKRVTPDVLRAGWCDHSRPSELGC